MRHAIVKNIPQEVLIVWAMQRGTKYVGADMYRQIQDTIEKYPEYFPWEHTYSSIPQEVHNKFEEESDDLQLSFYPRKESDIKPGEGIYSWLKRQEPVVLKQVDIEEALDYLFVTAPKIEKQYEIEKIKLWNKHYKKYNLKYKSDE